MRTPATIAVAAALLGFGCTPPLYQPARATRPYPTHLHLTETIDADGDPVKVPVVVDMQVFRDDQHIVIVNSTARSYRDFSLWLNQRYVRPVDALPAGATRRFSLWDFVDERGDVFNAGGLFRTREPLPVRLVEIEPGEDRTLIGLVAIPE